MKHLAFVEFMVEPSKGTIALNEEGSLSSEMSGAKVLVTGGPLTVEFDVAHLEEGRGRLESYHLPQDFHQAWYDETS